MYKDTIFKQMIHMSFFQLKHMPILRSLHQNKQGRQVCIRSYKKLLKYCLNLIYRFRFKGSHHLLLLTYNLRRRDINLGYRRGRSRLEEFFLCLRYRLLCKKYNRENYLVGFCIYNLYIFNFSIYFFGFLYW